MVAAPNLEAKSQAARMVKVVADVVVAPVEMLAKVGGNAVVPVKGLDRVGPGALVEAGVGDLILPQCSPAAIRMVMAS